MPSFLLEEAEGNAGKTIGKAYADGEYGQQLQKDRAAMKGKAGEGYGSRKEEDNSKGRTARAEKSNGDSRKYGPEHRRTVRGFRGSGECQNSVGSACRSAAGCGWRLMNSSPRPKARRTV